MNKREFEAQMRSMEYFHSMRLLPETWAIIRVDGRNFSQLTKKNQFARPFADKMRDLMVAAAEALLVEMQGIYVCTHSDEISLLLPRHWDLFDRKLEKTVSISASVASAAFTAKLGQVAHFDSRVWLGPDLHLVIDYFRWRQTDARRCALNSWCYWTLRRAGQSARSADRDLQKQSLEYKYQMLLQHGVNFKEVPKWQRHGIGLYWQEYAKEGYNPKTQQKVIAKRKHIKVDSELPFGDDYGSLIENIARQSERGAQRPDFSAE